MPIQVVISKKPRYYGYIGYFSTGPNGTITCRSQVTLQAEVVGDLTGHTLLWEQLSGDPVTFLTDVVDNLTMTFEYDLKDDKLFRLWLDKGTPFERYDDVWAWSTPTERHYLTTHLNPLGHTAVPYFDKSFENEYIRVTSDFSTYEDALDSEGTGHDRAIVISYWYPSTGKELITHRILQRYENGAWVDYALSAPETLIVPIEQGYMYRVQTYFQQPELYGNRYYVVQSSNIRVMPDHSVTWGETSTTTGFSHLTDLTHKNTSWDVLERFLIENSEPLDTAPDTNSHLSPVDLKWTGYNVLERVVVKFDEPLDEAPPVNAYLSKANHHITVFDVIDLVNIEIGSTTNITIGG